MKLLTDAPVASRADGLCFICLFRSFTGARFNRKANQPPGASKPNRYSIISSQSCIKLKKQAPPPVCERALLFHSQSLPESLLEGNTECLLWFLLRRIVRTEKRAVSGAWHQSNSHLCLEMSQTEERSYKWTRVRSQSSHFGMSAWMMSPVSLSSCRMLAWFHHYYVH